MNETGPAVRIYYLPQQFPCGPSSACCGPIGQTAAELEGYVATLRAAIPGCEPEVIDASGKLHLGRDLPAIKLLNAFGAAASPIFMVGGEVVSMGPPDLTELVGLIGQKLATSRQDAAASP